MRTPKRVAYEVDEQHHKYDEARNEQGPRQLLLLARSSKSERNEVKLCVHPLPLRISKCVILISGRR